MAAKKKKSSSKSSSSKSESSSSSASKVEQISKAIRSGGPLVALSDHNFSKFVNDRPRDYYAVLVLTATDPQYGCSVCVKAKGNLEDVAKLYHSQYNISEIPVDQRVIFFKAEVDDARNIFTQLRVETVPRTFILPPVDTNSKLVPMQEYEIEGRGFLEGLSSSVDTLNNATKVKIQILQSPFLFLFTVAVFAVFLSLFVSAAAYDVLGSLLWYQTPKIWVIISVICFGVGVSGCIFCIIRSAPPLGFSHQGTLSIFSPQGRDQYLVEGIIVALWTVGAGLAAYFAAYSTKIPVPLLREVLVLVFMTCFIVLGVQIWMAYVSKTAWYSLKETIPPVLWTYITSGVKKNSDLFKRLLRMSEIWLFEIKGLDFEAFEKKFQLLVVDYVKRSLYIAVEAKK
jgi:hypothetical protein